MTEEEMMDAQAIVVAQRDLARLRRPHKTQAEIAGELGVDASRISRLEKGESLLGEDELRSYLEAIGSDEACCYLDYLDESWRDGDRPDFWHPSRKELLRAYSVRRHLEEFVTEQEVGGPLRAEIDLLLRALADSTSYLSDLEHKIAFVGDIGVGKSTAICLLTQMVLPEKPSKPMDLSRRAVLYTTSGGATVCEVRIKHRRNTPIGIIVQPQSLDEILKNVGDLCTSLLAKQGDQSPESSNVGLPEELNRALRNLAGLARKRVKAADGRSAQVDPALDLARSLGDPEKFRAEFFARMRLAERTTCELWFDDSSGKSELEWLQDAFERVNTGRYPGVSLPQRIDILLRDPTLNSQTFPVELIDTKGVDGSAVRPDITAYIDDPRTLVILCSRYNSAPDVSIQNLINHVSERGAGEMLRVGGGVLVLPHSAEAEDTRDDSGSFAEDAEESYAIKGEQVASKLVELNSPDMPVLFFNAERDDHRTIAPTLLRRLEDMRAARVRRVNDIEAKAQYLISHFQEEQANAARDEARRQLRIFVDGNGVIPERRRFPYQALLDAVRASHQRSLWATTRRRGNWYNLDVYHYLGAGVEIDANLRTSNFFEGLNVLMVQMMADEALDPAQYFILEVSLGVERWRREFLSSITTSGRERLREALYKDGNFWDQCEDRYGWGSGYKDDIVSLLRDWFERDACQQILRDVEGSVVEAWQHRVIGPLRELCSDPAPPDNSV